MSFRNFLLGLDQWAGTLIGGYPDETISAKAYRMAVVNGSRGWFRVMQAINWLFRDPQHCLKAWESETKRRQAPPGEG